jgi:hypothetical protein
MMTKAEVLAKLDDAVSKLVDVNKAMGDYGWEYTIHYGQTLNMCIIDLERLRAKLNDRMGS